MNTFWKSAITAGGISTIGAFVFWSLYKNWLQLSIFERLSSDQTFIIMLVFLTFTLMAFISLVVLHFKTNKVTPKQSPEVTLIYTNLNHNKNYEQSIENNIKTIRPRGMKNDN